MVKKRKQDKKKKYLKYEILTPDLLEVICNGYAVIMRELSDIDIDLNDKELIKKIWNTHKEAVMQYWSQDPKGNAGRRPEFWWIIEAPEPKRILRYEDSEIEGEPEDPIYESNYAYLKRLNLLEEGWEIEEFKRIRKIFGKGSIYLRDWDYDKK